MKPKYIFFLVLVGLLAYGAWYLTTNDNQPNPSNQEQGSNNPPPGLNPQDNVEEVPNSLSGQLQKSNDSRKGNLMLKLADSERTIYLNTSRDFSSLVGKDVVVTIDGSLDDFRLVDIKAK